jgi:hypothetical protein
LQTVYIVNISALTLSTFDIAAASRQGRIDRYDFSAFAQCVSWLECAMVVTAGTRAYKPVARFANPALIVAFLWSAGLNAFAFSAASSVLWMTVVAASLGASIPALIYAGTRSWAALTIESRRAA